MALLGSVTGMACELPQVGLPAAVRMSPDAGGDSDNTCRSLHFDLSRPEGDVILVVDRSSVAGSSNQERCPECTTYWNSLRDAIEVLTGNQDDQFHFGLKLFPSVPADTCQVTTALEVAVSSSGGQEIISLLDTTSPGGQAPAKLGLRSAINALSSPPSRVPKMIVLALAGLPTCGGADITQDDTSNVMSEIGQATTQGIPVYVMGAGRIQATLDRMASAGNTDMAYSAYMPWDLLMDMQTYGWSNAPCTYALPKGIGASPAISLTFDDEEARTPRPIYGFTVASDGTSVTLDEAACADMRGPTVEGLTIEINCPP